jgi:hypothetical protein
MSELTWDEVGTRFFETGVDKGVLYIPNDSGEYDNGVAWSGLVTVKEGPTGGAAKPQYADNLKYLNLVSVEEFGAQIDAFTYPDEFQLYDGLVVPVPGVAIGQQVRKFFGLSYRTKYGNDLLDEDYAYKLHLLYGAKANPTDKSYTTMNDSPAGMTFSWKVDCTPVNVDGLRPTSLITISSADVNPDTLAALELILYGTTGVNPALPMPNDIVSMFESGVTTVPTLTVPTFATPVLTIPTLTGIEYYVDGVLTVAGDVTLTSGNHVVTAQPVVGYVIGAGNVNEWEYTV